jgi:Flp pilus assembly protein TadD
MALRGNIQGAVKRLRRRWRGQPGNALAHAQLGELYIALGRQSDAGVHWQRVLELDPSNLQALHNMGALYTDEKQYDQGSGVPKSRRAPGIR